MLYAFNYYLIHEDNSAISKRISPNYTNGYEKLQSVSLPQFLADQLTLFESGGEIMPTPLLYSPRISTFVYDPAQSISVNQKAWM